MSTPHGFSEQPEAGLAAFALDVACFSQQFPMFPGYIPLAKRPSFDIDAKQ
jgi:hypothetical protein